MEVWKTKNDGKNEHENGGPTPQLSTLVIKQPQVRQGDIAKGGDKLAGHKVQSLELDPHIIKSYNSAE